jgi:hypothetical protein
MTQNYSVKHTVSALCAATIALIASVSPAEAQVKVQDISSTFADERAAYLNHTTQNPQKWWSGDISTRYQLGHKAVNRANTNAIKYVPGNPLTIEPLFTFEDMLAAQNNHNAMIEASSDIAVIDKDQIASSPEDTAKSPLSVNSSLGQDPFGTLDVSNSETDAAVANELTKLADSPTQNNGKQTDLLSDPAAQAFSEAQKNEATIEALSVESTQTTEPQAAIQPPPVEEEASAAVVETELLADPNAKNIETSPVKIDVISAEQPAN